MITLKELKDKIGDLPDDTVLRFYGYIENDCAFGGRFDSDCSVSFEVNETEVIVEVCGDEGCETGGFD